MTLMLGGLLSGLTEACARTNSYLDAKQNQALHDRAASEPRHCLCKIFFFLIPKRRQGHRAGCVVQDAKRSAQQQRKRPEPGKRR